MTGLVIVALLALVVLAWVYRRVSAHMAFIKFLEEEWDRD